MTGADPSIIAVDFPLEFALGACAWLFRDRIPVQRSVAVLALIATVVALGAGAFISLGIVPLAYLVLWVSVSIRRSIRTDLSYGVYLYAFPLQQLAAAFGLHALGFAPFLAIGMGSSLAVASLSWRFVERPAMAMKRLSWRLAAPQPAAETSLSLTERAPAE